MGMLSETTTSVVGGVDLANSDGVRCRAYWKDFSPWSGQREHVVTTAGGVVVQRFSIGNVGRPVRIEIPWMSIDTYDDLHALAGEPAVTATLYLAKGSSVHFTKLYVLRVSYDNGARVSGGMLKGVVIEGVGG